HAERSEGSARKSVGGPQGQSAGTALDPGERSVADLFCVDGRGSERRGVRRLPLIADPIEQRRTAYGQEACTDASRRNPAGGVSCAVRLVAWRTCKGVRGSTHPHRKNCQ